jgi:hypothetical protein
MRIRRAIIIPAILALGSAAPIVAVSAVPAVAAAASNAPMHSTTTPLTVGIFYHA